MKRAEQRTRHLASFPQLNPNPVLEVTGSGVLAFSNAGAQTALESLGMDKEDATVFLPHDIEAILRALEKKEEAYLYREVTLKDRVFGEDVYIAPQFDVVRIYTYDITEIKKAEAISGRLAAIVESADDAIISKDLNGIIMSWNRGAEKIYGYTAAEAIGRHISFLTPPGHTNEVTDILARIAQGEHIERFETERMRKDGVILPVSLTFSAIKDERGRIIGASKIAHDITERKRAAEALQESEAKYRNLFANITEEVHLWELIRDEEDNIKTWKLVDANPPALKIWGKTLDQIKGKTTDEIFGPGATEHYLPTVRKIMTEGTPYAYEDFFPNLDRYFRFTSIPLGDRFITTGYDITTIKKSQMQLEQQRNREEAVNRILHAGLTSKTDEDLGESCLAAALDVTGSQFGFIGEIGPDDLLHDIAISDMGWDLCSLYDREGQRRAPGNFHIHGVYGRVLLDGKGFFTNAPSTHPDSIGTAEGHPPLTSFLGVPLIRDARTVGMIAVANREGGYSFEEQEALEALAPAVVEAFSRKRAEDALRGLAEDLEKKVQERTRFYSVLAKISEAMVRIRDRQILFDKVCRVIVEQGHFRLAWVGLLDQESSQIQPAASAGQSAYLDGIRIVAADVPEGQGPTGRAAHENRYIISNDFEKNPGMQPWRDRAIAHGLRSSSAFPLHTGGKVVGVLTIYSDRPDFFAEEEVSLLAALSEDISFALDSMEIEKKRSEAEEALRVLNEELDLRVKGRTAELREVNKELEAFIYSVSHDLRAPLRTVSEFARIVKEDYADKIDEQGRDYLTRVSMGAAKMSRLIDDLLYLSRITRQELVRSSVDISEAARAVVKELCEAQPDRSVEVEIEPELFAQADPRLIEVALSNIIGNAWKFTAKSAEARVEFGTIEKEGKTVYYVRDNGAGFDPKYAEKMFLPFQRLHTAQEFEGTGIGLTIVERVVRRHGGRIWAEGEPGKGSTVYFTLEATDREKTK
ncbi:MAG: GAF domain-containing protein, partial [Deltaproteobacteria bacterium]